MADALPELMLAWQADQVPNPALVVLNQKLAAQLGLDADELINEAGVQVLAGNRAPAGTHTLAMGYAGHQFGQYSPRLGDGRALLLGEFVTEPAGERFDVHLKGSGRTPFSRGGDGKAELGPMLREYVIAEAMHALGVPTGRALAVVATGEDVLRQDGPAPGGVLTRVAASHIRVGTFEYAVRHDNGAELVKRLADYAMHRHFPHLDTEDYLGFLTTVIEKQAHLIARWMGVGFIHGVMNTDNMTISGETIDYGPCAFMDAYDPATVFSSIDHAGRYAFGNQPPIAQWNLTRLAETLLPVIIPQFDGDQDQAVEAVTQPLNQFGPLFRANWLAVVGHKLGIQGPADPASITDLLPVGGAGYPKLIDELFGRMKVNGADFTLTFRALADHLRGRPLEPWLMGWLESWLEAVDIHAAESGLTRAQIADAMDAVNPIYIPRNHLVDEALAKATEGDLDAFGQLMAHVLAPFVPRPGPDHAYYSQPAPPEFTQQFRTFCGT